MYPLDPDGSVIVGQRFEIASSFNHSIHHHCPMGYVFDFQDARACDEWFKKRSDHCTASLETRLMLDMLHPAQGETVLDIGCGNGACLMAFLELDIQVTGIDASQYMLDLAYENVGNRADLYRGFAEDLPFDDNSFNHACLFTTLEFVDDPVKAIAEAARVAKDRLFIGVLNRYAIKGIQRRFQGIFNKTIYNRAQFFGIWELKNMIHSTCGDVPITWRTVSQFPPATGRIAARFEQSRLVQRFPFGTFAGMVVTLVPRFRTRPLTLKYRPDVPQQMSTGFAGSLQASGLKPTDPES